jgi:hypothetical protein
VHTNACLDVISILGCGQPTTSLTRSGPRVRRAYSPVPAAEVVMRRSAGQQTVGGRPVHPRPAPPRRPESRPGAGSAPHLQPGQCPTPALLEATRHRRVDSHPMSSAAPRKSRITPATISAVSASIRCGSFTLPLPRHAMPSSQKEDRRHEQLICGETSRPATTSPNKNPIVRALAWLRRQVRSGTSSSRQTPDHALTTGLPESLKRNSGSPRASRRAPSRTATITSSRSS